MSMSDDDLKLQIEATLDTDNIKKGTKEIEDSINKLGDTNDSVHKQIQEQSEKTGTVWMKVFNLSNAVSLVKNGAEMIIGAVKQIGAVVMDFRDAADDSQDAVDGLNLQLKNMGRYSEENSEKLIDFADTMQEVTNYSDEAVEGGETLLQTFKNIPIEIMEEATERMLDMNSIMGGDLKGSAVQLGKALDDPIEGISALSRIGITFNETQKETIKKFMEQNDIISAQKVILQELNTEFGGHARLQVDAIEQSKNAWQTFKEVLGARVQPVVDSVFTGVSKLMGIASKLFSKNMVDDANDYAEAVRKQKTEFDTLSITYTRLSANQNKTKEETKVYKDTIAELKKQYPEFLKNIDLEKDGYNGVATALAKINEHLNKKLLFSMKEKEMAKEQQRIIDAELKKYETTVKQNEALSQQQALINQLSKKTETWQSGRYVTNPEGNKEFVKFTAKDADNDPTIMYENGEYLKKMLVAEDEYALSTEKHRLANMKERFAKKIASYDAEKAEATNKIIEINKKYDAIAGTTKEGLETAEKGLETGNRNAITTDYAKEIDKKSEKENAITTEDPMSRFNRAGYFEYAKQQSQREFDELESWYADITNDIENKRINTMLDATTNYERDVAQLQYESEIRKAEKEKEIKIALLVTGDDGTKEELNRELEQYKKNQDFLLQQKLEEYKKNEIKRKNFESTVGIADPANYGVLNAEQLQYQKRLDAGAEFLANYKKQYEEEMSIGEQKKRFYQMTTTAYDMTLKGIIETQGKGSKALREGLKQQLKDYLYHEGTTRLYTGIAKTAEGFAYLSNPATAALAPGAFTAAAYNYAAAAAFSAAGGAIKMSGSSASSSSSGTSTDLTTTNSTTTESTEKKQVVYAHADLATLVENLSPVLQKFSADGWVLEKEV